MKKDDEQDIDMREKYDLSPGTRGKYAKRFAEGSNVIVLEPGVNNALREQIRRRRATGATPNSLLRQSLSRVMIEP